MESKIGGEKCIFGEGFRLGSAFLAVGSGFGAQFQT